MRRLHLRGRENVAKRVPVHAAGFNLGPLMRLEYGLRKPRSLTAAACAPIFAPVQWLRWAAAASRGIETTVPLRHPAGRWDLALSAL